MGTKLARAGSLTSWWNKIGKTFTPSTGYFPNLKQMSSEAQSRATRCIIGSLVWKNRGLEINMGRSFIEQSIPKLKRESNYFPTCILSYIEMLAKPILSSFLQFFTLK
jgi:hypothetical protein